MCVTGVKKYCCAMPSLWLSQLPNYFALTGGLVIKDTAIY